MFISICIRPEKFGGFTQKVCHVLWLPVFIGFGKMEFLQHKQYCDEWYQFFHELSEFERECLKPCNELYLPSFEHGPCLCVSGQRFCCGHFDPHLVGGDVVNGLTITHGVLQRVVVLPEAKYSAGGEKERTPDGKSAWVPQEFQWLENDWYSGAETAFLEHLDGTPAAKEYYNDLRGYKTLTVEGGNNQYDRRPCLDDIQAKRPRVIKQLDFVVDVSPN
jgi:hypothetical protein